MASENQPGKDSSMKQKPYNDNLVMASIKSLYEQSSYINRPRKAGLRRHNPNNLPILGSLPVQIGHDQEKSRLDDVVLIGRLQAGFTDENQTTITARKGADEGEEDNPFLAIRQAVIAAGDEKNQIAEQQIPSKHAKSISETSEMVQSKAKHADKLPAEPAEQTFANQLANLIDSEIERRMAERTSYAHKPDRVRPPDARTRKKQKMPVKKQKSKKKATAGTAAKKPSAPKRKQPK